MSDRKKERSSCRNNRLRRLAIQIAGQLPEKKGDARDVLKFAEELVGFMTSGEAAPTSDQA